MEVLEFVGYFVAKRVDIENPLVGWVGRLMIVSLVWDPVYVSGAGPDSPGCTRPIISHRAGGGQCGYLDYLHY